MLSLPDEMILEFLQKYPQRGRSDYKSFWPSSRSNSDSFHHSHQLIDSNTSNLNSLYRICLVCKRLYRLAMPLLYQRIIVNNADSIYLLLRTLIEDPDLAPYVVEITLNGRLGIQDGHRFRRYAIAGNAKKTGEKELGRKKGSKSQRGTLYELTLSAQEVQQLSMYAEKFGLEEKYILSLRSGDRNFGEIVSVLLIMSLPSLKSLQIHQGSTDRYKVFDQLLLEILQNPQLCKISNRLTTFKRISGSVWARSTSSPRMIDEMVAAILFPSISTLTIAQAGRAIFEGEVYHNPLDLNTLINAHSESSPVESIYINQCLIQGLELYLLLKFPRSLRLLSLVPWEHSASNFLSVQMALNKAGTNVLDCLVTLHIGKAHWGVRDYNPSGFFRLFRRLERPAVPVELLLVNGREPLEDWQYFFPPTLTHLTFYALGSYLDPNFNHLCPVIEQQIESKQKGEGRIRIIGADSWLEVYPLSLARLVSRGKEVGVKIAQVKDSGNPFHYDNFEQEE